MPIYVDIEKCDACGECIKHCPGDLIALDTDTQKALIRNNDDCWHCMTCLKLCPLNALTLELPKSLVHYKVTLMPEVTEDTIKWTLVDADGKEETFVIQRKEVGG